MPNLPITPVPVSSADKRRAFRRLHESGCFLIPNPWDAGSARYLQSLGFKALATTSSGAAWSQGRPDNGLSRAQVLEHLRIMAAATDLPLNADFENGFADGAAAVGESVRLAIDAGIAGLSIEDSTPANGGALFPLDVAVERMRAARRAIDDSGADVLLIGRAECFLAGLPDIDLTVARLRAYAAAGADCLYAPGIRSAAHIRAVVEAVRPKPVNLLVGGPGELSLAQMADLGVRRISVGGALARAAWGGFMRAARELAEQGSFDGLAGAATHDSMNALFAAVDHPAPT
jgi:2-methylisocitrate lyase-like PEP mutase family enzyme